MVHLDHVTPEEGAVAAAVTAAAMIAAAVDGGDVTGVGVAAVVVDYESEYEPLMNGGWWGVVCFLVQGSQIGTMV